MKKEVYPVWKEEGEHTLENLKGICVPMINGQRILVYPKYKELPLVETNRIKDYDAPCCNNEWDAMYDNRNMTELTDMLIKVDSPAAKYVRELGMDLPNFNALAAVMHYMDEINKVSKSVGGDILDKGSYYWSSCRCFSYYAWFANGYFGLFYNGFMYGASVCVPLSLYTE